MQRKIIKQGMGGHTIYLPKDWILNNSLDKGDELNITLSGKDLIISPISSKKKIETELTLKNNLEPSIKVLVTNAYRIGYDKIKINLDSDKQKKIVQGIIRDKLLGFEITETDNKYYIIENISEPSEIKFESILKKLFMSIGEHIKNTKKMLENDKDIEDYNEIQNRIERYDNFCRRLIFKDKLINKNTENYWSFLVFIIAGVREIYRVNELGLKKHKKSPETIKLIEFVEEYFKIIEESFFNRNMEKLVKIHEMNHDIFHNKFDKIFESNIDSQIKFYLCSCLRHFNFSTSPLIGLLLKKE